MRAPVNGFAKGPKRLQVRNLLRWVPCIMAHRWLDHHVNVADRFVGGVKRTPEMETNAALVQADTALVILKNDIGSEEFDRLSNHDSIRRHAGQTRSSLRVQLIRVAAAAQHDPDRQHEHLISMVHQNLPTRLFLYQVVTFDPGQMTPHTPRPRSSAIPQLKFKQGHATRHFCIDTALKSIVSGKNHPVRRNRVACRPLLEFS